MPDSDPIRAAIKWWRALTVPKRQRLIDFRKAISPPKAPKNWMLAREAIVHLTELMNAIQRNAPSPEDAARLFGDTVQSLLSEAAPPPLDAPVRPPMPDPNFVLPEAPKISVSDDAAEEDFGEP